jgi:hypothetical protein
MNVQKIELIGKVLNKQVYKNNKLIWNPYSNEKALREVINELGIPVVGEFNSFLADLVMDTANHLIELKLEK